MVCVGCVLEDEEMERMGREYLSWKALSPERSMTFQQYLEVFTPRLSGEWFYVDNRSGKMFGGTYV